MGKHLMKSGREKRLEWLENWQYIGEIANTIESEKLYLMEVDIELWPLHNFWGLEVSLRKQSYAVCA